METRSGSGSRVHEIRVQAGSEFRVQSEGTWHSFAVSPRSQENRGTSLIRNRGTSLIRKRLSVEPYMWWSGGGEALPSGLQRVWDEGRAGSTSGLRFRRGSVQGSRGHGSESMVQEIKVQEQSGTGPGMVLSSGRAASLGWMLGSRSPRHPSGCSRRDTPTDRAGGFRIQGLQLVASVDAPYGFLDLITVSRTRQSGCSRRGTPTARWVRRRQASGVTGVWIS